MIEVVENTVQLALLLALTARSGMLAARERRRGGALLALFYGCYALGDLYYLLFLLFYGHTPQLSFAPDLSWYAGYAHLFLLLQEVCTPDERRYRHPALWLAPVFVVGMCAFYLQWGDVISNLISAVLMILLLTHAVRGLLYLRGRPEEGNRRALYCVTLMLCALEYGAWTASCFWAGDTWANPYFWFDALLTASFALFLPAYRRAVAT